MLFATCRAYHHHHNNTSSSRSSSAHRFILVWTALSSLSFVSHVQAFAPRTAPAVGRTWQTTTPSRSSTRTRDTAATVTTHLSMAAASSQDELKKQVGYKAVDDYVQSGMVVGLGTGSTAYFAVERVGEKLQSGELQDIVAIPTSLRTQEQAERLGIPLVSLDTHSKLDVAIDGADQVDDELNLTKGGGGALFREKIVEVCADKFIVIVDESKLCPQGSGLGPGFPIPVEIVPFCHQHTLRQLTRLPSIVQIGDCTPVLRLGSASNNQVDGDEPAVTDNGNYIVDLHFQKPIPDPTTLGHELKNVVGVVEHGLFCGMSTVVIVAGKDGVYVKEPVTVQYQPKV